MKIIKLLCKLIGHDKYWVYQHHNVIVGHNVFRLVWRCGRCAESNSILAIEP